MRTLFIVGCSLLLSVLTPTALSGCISDDDPEPGEGHELAVGERLPSLSVRTLSGDTLTTDSLLGRRSVVVLFSPLCGDCREALPMLERVYQETVQRQAGVRFLCIARSASEQRVRELWDELRLTMPAAGQEDDRLFRLFAPHTVPRVYVCDAGGRVRHILVEHFTEEELRRIMRF